MIKLKSRASKRFDKVVELINKKTANFSSEKYYNETIEKHWDVYYNLCITYIDNKIVLRQLITSIDIYQAGYNNTINYTYKDDVKSLYLEILTCTKDIDFKVELITNENVRKFSSQFNTFLDIILKNKDISLLTKIYPALELEEDGKVRLIQRTIEQSNDFTFFKQVIKLTKYNQFNKWIMVTALINVDITEYLLNTYNVDLKLQDKRNAYIYRITEIYNTKHILNKNNKMLEMIKLLVKHGADLSHFSKYEINKGSKKLIEYFIDNDTKIDSIFLDAINDSNFNLIKYIIESKSSVELNHFFYRAVEKNNEIIIDYLLEQDEIDLNKNVENFQHNSYYNHNPFSGMTHFSVLSFAQNIEVAKKLISYGAIIEDKTIQKTALSYIYKNNSVGTEKYKKLLMFYLKEVKDINKIDLFKIFNTNARVIKIKTILDYILKNKKEITHDTTMQIFKAMINKYSSYLHSKNINKIDLLKKVYSCLNKEELKDFDFSIENIVKSEIGKKTFSTKLVVFLFENFTINYKDIRLSKNYIPKIKLGNFSIKQLKKIFEIAIDDKKIFASNMRLNVIKEITIREISLTFENKKTQAIYNKAIDNSSFDVAKEVIKTIKKIINGYNSDLNELQSEKVAFTKSIIENVERTMTSEELFYSLLFNDVELFNKAFDKFEFEENTNVKIRAMIEDLKISVFSHIKEEMIEAILSKNVFENNLFLEKYFYNLLKDKKTDTIYKFIKKHNIDFSKFKDTRSYYNYSFIHNCRIDKHGQELIIKLIKDGLFCYTQHYLQEIVDGNNIKLYVDFLNNNTNEELYKINIDTKQISYLLESLEELFDFASIQKTLVLFKDSYDLIELYDYFTDTFDKSLSKQMILNIYKNSKSITIKNRTLFLKFKEEFRKYLAFTNIINNFKQI